jgi:hypothetical protein
VTQIIKKRRKRRKEEEKKTKQKRMVFALTEENIRIILSHSLNERDALLEELDAGHISREQVRIVSQHVVLVESRRDVAHVLGAGLEPGDVCVARVVGQLARVKRVDVEAQQLQREVGSLVADVAERKRKRPKRMERKEVRREREMRGALSALALCSSSVSLSCVLTRISPTIEC